MPRSVLRRVLPDAAALRENRALRWLGPLLERPWLWRLDRRSVALGLALGVFFGLLVPLGQVPIVAMLGTVIAILAVSVAASLARPVRNRKGEQA